MPARRAARRPALRSPSLPDGGAPLLEVSDLCVDFVIPDGTLRAVQDVSFTVDPKETLAIVGESGSGKTVTAQAIMGILDIPPARIVGGSVRYLGLDLLRLPERELLTVRGRQMAMIFQDPLTALNPTIKVGDQIGEMFTQHLGLTHSDAWSRAEEVMDQVRIPRAHEVRHSFPHQLSGGLRQRVAIAMALSLSPKLLIADEPTTAIDVSIQAQILQLLAELRDEHGMSVLLITHDLGLVAELADRAIVMYAGKVMESGEVASIFARPANPYTAALMRTMPRVDRSYGRLTAIPGSPPDGMHIPPGCPFHPRCWRSADRCRCEEPPLHDFAERRGSACHFYEELVGDDPTR